MATEVENETMLAAAIYRGAVIQAWAHVEFMATDLVMRAKRLPEYAAADLAFKYRFEGRIAELKRLLTHPGPLDSHKAAILEHLDGMDRFETHRHFMAHGLMTVRTPGDDDEDESQINLRLYNRVKGGRLEMGHMPTDLQQMQNLAMDIGEASNKIVGPLARAVVDLGLDPA